MKNILSILFVFSLGISLYGQEEDEYQTRKNDNGEIHTLFGRNKVNNGGYGGFGAGYTWIDNKDAVTTSGRGAWIIGHGLALGFSGTGFINSFHYDPFVDANVNLTGGYGGFLIEPILFGRFPIHLSFPIIAGLGGIAYTQSQWANDPWEYQNSLIEDYDSYIILEPGVELELNILKFFRMGIGISYRMTSEISLMNTSPDVLDGISGGVNFKFGKF